MDSSLSPWKIFSIWLQINKELCVVMSKVLSLGPNRTIQHGKTGTIHQKIQNGSLILEPLGTKSSEPWETKLNYPGVKTVDDSCSSVQSKKKKKKVPHVVTSAGLYQYFGRNFGMLGEMSAPTQNYNT